MDNNPGNWNNRSDIYPQTPQPMRPMKKKKQQSLLNKFLRTFFISLFIFIICTGAVVIGYGMLANDNAKRDDAVANKLGTGLREGKLFSGIFDSVPEFTNFLILGLDNDGTRTDVMMVGTFNSKKELISLVSIPRDTYVYMSEKNRSILKEEGLWTPSDGGMKINEVHHYAGKEYGVDFTVKQVEELLDIKIEYYVKVNLEAFKFIVDEIDGVYFDVPQNMFYEDPFQNLYINLKAGPQTLDGEHAMQLVRFRSYKIGDWQRVKVQQDFVKAVITQVLSSDNIIKNAKPLLEMVYNYVETNMQITDALKYLGYASSLNSDSIVTYTLPGTDSTIRGRDFVLNDAVGTSEIVDEVFRNFADNEEDVPSEDKEIQILNGADKSGLAAKNKEFLEDKGFTVENISDFSGSKTDYTRIYVNKRNYGKDIKELYPGSKIIVDKDMTKDYDIVIVLGTNEE